MLICNYIWVCGVCLCYWRGYLWVNNHISLLPRLWVHHWYRLKVSSINKPISLTEKNSHQLLSPVPIIHGNNLSGLAPFAPLPHHHIGNPVIHFISEMAEKL